MMDADKKDKIFDKTVFQRKKETGTGSVFVRFRIYTIKISNIMLRSYRTIEEITDIF